MRTKKYILEGMVSLICIRVKSGPCQMKVMFLVSFRKNVKHDHCMMFYCLPFQLFRSKMVSRWLSNSTDMRWTAILHHVVCKLNNCVIIVTFVVNCEGMLALRKH